MEDSRGWAVGLGGVRVASAVIFGVAYSFAAFFRSFAAEFAVDRADVSLVFGISGLIYFLLGAGAGMLADRYGPRAVCAAGMLFIAGGLLASSFAHSMAAIYVAWGGGLGIGIGLVYAPSIAQRAAVVRAPARVRRGHRQRRDRRRHARGPAARDVGDRRARLAPRAAGARRRRARRRHRRDAAAAARPGRGRAGCGGRRHVAA